MTVRVLDQVVQELQVGSGLSMAELRNAVRTLAARLSGPVEDDPPQPPGKPWL